MLFESRGICPVCNTPAGHWCTTQDWEYRSTAEYYSYLKCPSCDTLFLEKLEEDDLLKIYPTNYYSFQSSTGTLFQIKNWWDGRFYKTILKQILQKKIAVLDVGGGTGQVLDMLRHADKRVTYTEIVDIDLNAQKLAEKKGHIYIRTSIESYRTDKKFDVILLLNIIEHVEKPGQLIETARDLLSEDGIIIVKTPNSDSLDARLFKNYYWGGLHCPRHWIIFSDRSFRKMIADKNLNISSIKFTQGAAFWCYSTINLFRKKEIRLRKKPLIESILFGPLSIAFVLFDVCRSIFSKTSQMFIILRK